MLSAFGIGGLAASLLAEFASGGAGGMKQMIGQFTLLFVALPGIYTAYDGNNKASER